jgi:hypothetical protein
VDPNNLSFTSLNQFSKIKTEFIKLEKLEEEGPSEEVSQDNTLSKPRNSTSHPNVRLVPELGKIKNSMMRSKESVRKLSKSMTRKKYLFKESEEKSLKDLVSQNNVQKLEILKLDLMVWVVVFLKVLILGNTRVSQLEELVRTLQELDLFGLLITLYVQITEHNLRNLFLENFCDCRKNPKNNVACSDEYCEKDKISQLKKRVINASLELFLIIRWLREYHDFQPQFEDSMASLQALFPK